MGDLLRRAVLVYLEHNPATIERLIGATIDAIVHHLTTSQSAPSETTQVVVQKTP